MINVTIIGFGNVGSSLALHVLNNSYPICLNIMEPDEQCEGALLDLAHSMSLHATKELHCNNEELFTTSDFIFYTAGIKNEKGVSRLSTSQQNVKLTKEIFEHRSFQKSAFIIVITNPVDVISHAVHKYSGLHANQVLGTGTFLDSIRLEYYISSLCIYKLKDVKAVVVGEHGASQVPVYSNTKVKGKPILDSPEFSQEDLYHAQQLTLNAANKIRETQEATRYGVAKCAERIMDYMLSEEENFISVSTLTNGHYRQLLQLEQDIYISMPVIVKKGTIELNNDMVFSNNELTAYRKSAAILEKMIRS